MKPVTVYEVTTTESLGYGHRHERVHIATLNEDEAVQHARSVYKQAGLALKREGKGGEPQIPNITATERTPVTHPPAMFNTGIVKPKPKAKKKVAS